MGPNTPPTAPNAALGPFTPVIGGSSSRVCAATEAKLQSLGGAIGAPLLRGGLLRSNRVAPPPRLGLRPNAVQGWGDNTSGACSTSVQTFGLGKDWCEDLPEGQHQPVRAAPSCVAWLKHKKTNRGRKDATIANERLRSNPRSDQPSGCTWTKSST